MICVIGSRLKKQNNKSSFNLKRFLNLTVEVISQKTVVWIKPF